MLQPTPLRIGVNISDLEAQSQSDNSSTQRTSGLNPPAAPISNPPSYRQNESSAPLASFGAPTPRKSNKKRRVEPEDSENPRYPQPLDELLKLTAAQLRKVAHENSKGSFSVEDEEFFLEFYKEQEQALAIKAIERSVSLPMVHAFLGRRLAVREANKWNRFLQTEQAREIFQMSGEGVKNRQVMKLLSLAYNQLTAEQKAALVTAPAPDSVDNVDLDEEIPSTSQTNTRPAPRLSRAERSLTAAELALDDPADDDARGHEANGQPSYPLGVVRQSQPSILRGSVPNLHLKEQAQKVMNRWAGEAVKIAKTCNCEIVFFAVSKHLANHSFKLVRNTPGADESVKTLADIDGDGNYAARLQALITGNSVTQIAVKDKFPTSKKETLRALIPRLSKELGHLIARGTHNVITSWPWTDTDKVLRSAKFKVELSPRATSDIKWIKTPNRHLQKVPCSLILLDLSRGHIKISPIPPDELTNTNTENESVACGRNDRDDGQQDTENFHDEVEQ